MALQRVREAAEKAKCELSSSLQVCVYILNQLGLTSRTDIKTALSTTSDSLVLISDDFPALSQLSRQWSSFINVA